MVQKYKYDHKFQRSNKDINDRAHNGDEYNYKREIHMNNNLGQSTIMHAEPDDFFIIDGRYDISGPQTHNSLPRDDTEPNPRLVTEARG